MVLSLARASGITIAREPFAHRLYRCGSPDQARRLPAFVRQVLGRHNEKAAQTDRGRAHSTAAAAATDALSPIV
jgi:hypothetical protein